MSPDRKYRKRPFTGHRNLHCVTMTQEEEQALTRRAQRYKELARKHRLNKVRDALSDLLVEPISDEAWAEFVGRLTFK